MIVVSALTGLGLRGGSFACAATFSENSADAGPIEQGGHCATHVERLRLLLGTRYTARGLDAGHVPECEPRNSDSVPGQKGFPTAGDRGYSVGQQSQHGVTAMFPEINAEAAQKAWHMAQRVARQIAQMPLERRERAFIIAEQSLRHAARKSGVGSKFAHAFVRIQMNSIRHIVTDLDVSGNPQGGRA